MEQPLPLPPPVPPPAPSAPKFDLNWTSLLWIAVIVSICSGNEQRSNKNEIRELQEQIERLEKKIDRLAPPPAAPAR